LLLKHFDELVVKGYGVNYIALNPSVSESFKICLPHGRLSKKVVHDVYPNITEIRKAMEINNNRNVLIVFAWVTEFELNTL
jgi:hypothetical protein